MEDSMVLVSSTVQMFFEEQEQTSYDIFLLNVLDIFEGGKKVHDRHYKPKEK